MTGADAARVFYEPDRLPRAKALPPTALTLLQDFVTATNGCEAGAPTCGRADEARSTGWSAWSTSLSDEAPGRATGSNRHSA